MKPQHLLVWLLLLVSAGQATAQTIGQVSDFVKTLFSESELFTDKANIVWADYQLLSNVGKRPNLTKTVLPGVGLHVERQLWHGLGAQLSVATNWWQENRTLAETDTKLFNQLFDFRYYTVGLGPTYHFTINEKVDPYVGVSITYRRAQATCPCYTLSETTVSGDLYAGARYFVSNSFFVTGEVGQNGTGYAKIGTGFKF